jgi:hypothetical protein
MANPIDPAKESCACSKETLHARIIALEGQILWERQFADTHNRDTECSPEECEQCAAMQASFELVPEPEDDLDCRDIPV